MLELRGITKSYGGRRVLDDVTFNVAPGRLTGFVGGNGAGKTTTMRIVLGVLADDGGSVSLDGTPLTAADRRRFGYMPEERGLYPKMKVLEQIVYLARLHGYSKAEAESEATALLEKLGAENAMIVTETVNENVIKSARNIPGVETTIATVLSTYDIMKARSLVVDKAALAKIEEVYC